jgi:prepilin-type N-terminal cleavage/methylation domain-containing protein
VKERLLLIVPFLICRKNNKFNVYKSMNKTSKRGFTLIELLVVIAIIGILATIAVVALQQARQSARDSKRIADVKQIQTALELYYNNNFYYPDGISNQISDGTTVYMEIVPTAPTPADGDCDTSSNQYTYIVGEDNATYTLSFCLGSQTGGLAPGPKTATPSGIVSFFTSTSLAACINSNPGFENLSNLPNDWLTIGMKIEGFDFVESPEHAPILVSDAFLGAKAIKFQGDPERYSIIFSEPLTLNEVSSYETKFHAKGNGILIFGYTIDREHYWNFTLGQWDEDVGNPFDPNYIKVYPISEASYEEEEVLSNNVSAPTGTLSGGEVSMLFMSESNDIYIDNIRLYEDGVNIISNYYFDDFIFFPLAWGDYISPNQTEGYIEVESSLSHVYSGNYSMKLGVGAADTGSIELQTLVFPEGENTLNLSFFAKTGPGSNSDDMQIWIRDSNDNYYNISSNNWVGEWYYNWPGSLSNDFQEYSFVDIPFPPGGGEVSFVFTPDFNTSDSFFWIDNVCITYSE